MDHYLSCYFKRFIKLRLLSSSSSFNFVDSVGFWTKVVNYYWRSSCFFLRMSSRCSNSLFFRYYEFYCSALSFNLLSSSFFLSYYISSFSLLSYSLYSSIGRAGLIEASGGRGPNKLILLCYSLASTFLTSYTFLTSSTFFSYIFFTSYWY